MSFLPEACNACDYQLEASHKFCPNCGQKVKDKLSMKVLFQNTIKNYFSVDAKLFRSVIPLLFKPGKLAKEFVSGKQHKYLHPAQFYLFASIVFFALFSFVSNSAQQDLDSALQKTFDVADRAKDSITKIQDSIKSNTKKLITKEGDSVALTNLEKEKDKINDAEVETIGFSFNLSELDNLDKNASTEEKLKVMGITEESGFTKRLFAKQAIKLKERRGSGLLKEFYETIPVAMFFLIPIFALMLLILYRKKGSFVYHMVFSFYFFTFIFVSFIVLIIVDFIIDLPGSLIFLVVCSMMIYLLLSLKRYYEQGYVKTFFKTIFLTFVYMIVILPVSLVIISLVSFLTF